MKETNLKSSLKSMKLFCYLSMPSFYQPVLRSKYILFIFAFRTGCDLRHSFEYLLFLFCSMSMFRIKNYCRLKISQAQRMAVNFTGRGATNVYIKTNVRRSLPSFCGQMNRSPVFINVIYATPFEEGLTL